MPVRPLFDDPATVRHLARLARLELDDSTLGLLQRQLGDILAYVEQLAAVDTTGVEPTTFSGAETRFREPGIRLVLTREDALRNAPDAADGAFRVPRVV